MTDHRLPTTADLPSNRSCARLHACNTSFEQCLHYTTFLDTFMEETLVSFILLLKEFASKVVSVRSGRGLKTSPVTTVPPVPASKHPELPTHRKSRRIQTDHRASSIRRPNWLQTTTQMMSQSSDACRISDASLVCLRSAISKSRLRNS